jgi:aconitate hydratase
MRYQAEGTPLIVLAGKEYGSGSSRDWAAKGPYLQGIKAVIAESYERIHRSNLIGMGIVPLQFQSGDSVESLGLTGEEIFDVVGLPELIGSGFRDGRTVQVTARQANGAFTQFPALIRLDTPQELLYCRHGGILQYVLRQLLGGRDRPAAISAAGASSPQAAPDHVSTDRHVDKGSEQSFPASDPPAY